MSTDAVRRVKDSEADAKKIIDDANSKSTEIIESAKVDAKEAYDSLIEKAKKNRANIIKKAKETGAKNSEPILNEAKKEIDKSFNFSDDRAHDAIKSVVERIVNNNGNS